ncbi:MAG TPA: hypothetical protein VER33_05020, partial [Polyangiaceae bacterium]|nr:hypothetical protein [Polyangiaceae bacterium]
PLGREWIAVVEAHRTGWPHVNLMIDARELAEHVEREQAAIGPEFERLGFHAATLPPELMDLARRADWGTLSTIERVRTEGKVVNYLAKLAGEGDEVVNEIAKLTQLPRNAPLRFRRMRTGKGWLPKRRKNPDVTGTVVVRKFDEDDGSPLVFPINTVKNPLLIPHLAAIC